MRDVIPEQGSYIREEGSWAGLNVMVVSPTPTHPQDHGNRKRIYQVCCELKRRGARIEFVHYPSEHDWRHDWPARHEREMSEAWDDYHLVAPSRPLHESARGLDHGIDEWADPGLLHFIAWACRVRDYDVVLVNYTWMSFCFEAVPKSVFKICDTHDVFSGRRDLLEANGISPEFFHTTAADEARGLARADLVWAIKPAEQAYFNNELGLPHCLTLLHAEPQRDWWLEPPSRDGWLRAGVIGARNNINRRNLEEFLAEALPVFEHYMAPVKIVIAGGLSDAFEGLSHPNVQVVGRVAEVEAFYRQADVVIAPMRFSTGLKIKVSEALASGAPLVAHAHAMEGYPSQEPLHQLQSFREMAVELAKLSFERAPLLSLARRSRATCETIRADVSNAFDATRRAVSAALSSDICIVAPAEAFDPVSLLYDHLAQTLDYLRLVAGLAIFVHGKPPRTMDFDLLRRVELRRQLFVAPELASALGERAPDYCRAIRLGDLLAARGYTRAYLMSDCREELLRSSAALREVIVRYDAVGMAGGDADGLIASLRGHAELVVVTTDPTQGWRWQDDSRVAEIVYAPYRRTGAFESLERRSSGSPTPRALLVMRRGEDPIAEEVLRLAAKVGWAADCVDLADAATVDRLLGRKIESGCDELAGLSRRSLCVDLTEGDAVAAVVSEACIRCGVPRLQLQRGAIALGLYGFSSRLRPTSLAKLFTTIANCATNSAELDALRGLAAAEAYSKFGFDAGWTVLWARLAKIAL